VLDRGRGTIINLLNDESVGKATTLMKEKEYIEEELSSWR